MILAEQIEQRLKLNLTVEIKAHGQSMWPFIKSGQLLQLKAINPDYLEVGHFIVFKKDEAVICHLVIGKQNDPSTDRMLFITSGSSTKHDDLPVFSNEVIAQVINIKFSKFKLLLWVLRKRFNI